MFSPAISSPFMLPPLDLPVAFAAEEKGVGEGWASLFLFLSLPASPLHSQKNRSCMLSTGWRQRLLNCVGFNAYKKLS